MYNQNKNISKYLQNTRTPIITYSVGINNNSRV